MPVVNPTTTTAAASEIPTTVQIAKPEYRGVTVDTQYVPQSSLLSNIEGSAWTVNYYSQVVDTDNALSGQQVNREAIYQQYRLINQLEIRVTQALTQSQDQESKQITVTGTAITYPFMIPLEGDMFLADVGDGREAVFRITHTEKRTYFKESCFQIDYVLVDYSTEQRRHDLQRKVVQELYFERDFLIHGQNPLLQRQDYADLQLLQSRYEDLIELYFAMFSSKEFRTLVVPGQHRAVYDHFVMKAVTGLFDSVEAPTLARLRILNCDDQDALHCFTIWDALLQRKRALLPYCNRRAGLLTTRAFTERPQLEGIRYSGIDYVVYPKDLEVCVDFDIRPVQTPASGGVSLIEPRAPKPPPAPPPEEGEVPAPPAAPLVWPVLVDDYYVLSEAFYADLPNQSVLERAVRDYLDFKAPKRRTLVELVEAFHSFNPLERFYYGPILLLLVRSSIRSV